MSNFVNSIIDRTKATRAEAVLDPLKENDQLNAAVQKYGKDIVLANCINNEGSDVSSQLGVIDQADYGYTQAAKNIAVGQYTPEELVDG